MSPVSTHAHAHAHTREYPAGGGVRPGFFRVCGVRCGQATDDHRWQGKAPPSAPPLWGDSDGSHVEVMAIRLDASSPPLVWSPQPHSAKNVLGYFFAFGLVETSFRSNTYC